MRLRRRLVGSPIAFWVTAIALAGVTGTILAGLVSRAQVTTSRYGHQRAVVVATREVAAGQALRPGDVEVREMPAAFLPAGALTVAPLGRTVVVPLFPGEVVIAAKLAPKGLSGVAALLPPGTRAVAVPTGGASAPVRRGDVVDVLASFDPSTTGSGEPTVTVAVGALVVDVGDDVVTVAVLPEEASRVAFAVAHGVVTLALTGGPEAPRDRGRSPPRRGDHHDQVFRPVRV